MSRYDPEYHKEYNQRPEVQARRRARQASEEHRARRKAWRNTPEQAEKETAYRKDYYSKNREAILARARQDHLKRYYGLTHEQYEMMMDEQQGVCKICEGSNTGRFKYLAVDHDPHTGVIRGLLCNNCNTGIGLMNHDPERIRAAIAYLKRFEENN